MTHLKKAEELLFRILAGVTILCLVAILVLISGQIIGRYLRIQAIMTQDEIITLFFVWLVFLGSALLLREDGHIRIDLVDMWLKDRPRLRHVYQLLINALVLLFLLVMVRSALAGNRIAAMRRSPMLRWPDTLWFFALVSSSFLMVFYVIVKMLRNLAALVNPHSKTPIVTKAGH